MSDSYANGRPLRIVQVASGMPNWGGAELHLINLAEQLQQRGHSVDILCRTGSFVEKEAQKRGLSAIPAVVRSQSDFGALRSLYSLVKAGRYDVMHVHMFPDHIVPPLAARMARVPVVVMTHHLPHPLKPGVWKRYLIRRYLFNRAIGVSESVRQNLISSGLSSEQVVTIYHGTDAEKFAEVTRTAESVRREWGIPPDRFLAGMVGRITEEKGVGHFLRALANLCSLPVHGVLIGEGEKSAEMETLAASLKITERITFAGFRSDVNNAINALDVHVLASTWAEPCAAVVQQAMALGKPVIGTNIGGTPEMIVDQQTGILVRPGDDAEIARAIRYLYDNRGEAIAMGQRGFERVRQTFTLVGMVDSIEMLYRNELARVAGRNA